MNDRDLLRYERELGCRVSGFRRRKRIKEAFRQSLRPLLEEDPAPTYAALEQAFGSPAKLAEELQETTPDLPAPLSRRKKAGIAAVSCLLVVLVVLGGYFLLEVPESDAVVLDESSEAVLVLDTLLPQYSGLNLEPFTEADFVWKQPRECDSYLLILDNHNDVPTKVEVRYAKPQAPHAFQIPANARRVLLVKDARATEHVVSFVTNNGTLDGEARIYVAEQNP